MVSVPTRQLIKLGGCFHVSCHYRMRYERLCNGPINQGWQFFPAFLLNLERVSTQHGHHYLPILGQAPGLGQELQQGYEEAQAQAQAKQEEEAQQVLEPQCAGRVSVLALHAVVGPPLVMQVGELPALAEL